MRGSGTFEIESKEPQHKIFFVLNIIIIIIIIIFFIEN